MNQIEHLFSCLGEEGVEIALDCSKINRFGAGDHNPLMPEAGTNVERVVNELNDLLGVVRLLVEHGALPAGWASDDKQRAKMAKVVKFMGYAEEHGSLQR